MSQLSEQLDGSVFADRRKLMGGVHLISAIALTFFSMVHMLDGCCLTLSYLELFLASAMLLSWLLILRGASLAAIEYTLMMAAVALFSSLVLLDSVGDTGIYWVAGYPFVAYFGQPASRARYWVGFFLVAIAIIAGLDGVGWVDTPYSTDQLLYLESALAFYWLLAHIYKSQLELRQSQLVESYRTLTEQQQRLQVILDHSPIGIWMLDGDRHIQFLNRTWVNWCGISETEARQPNDYTELLSGSFAEQARILDQACPGSDVPACSQEAVLCADGASRTLEIIRVSLTGQDGAANGMVGFAIDVTAQIQAQAEQQQLAQQVHHGQRLESLGVMAGGIAHDFNNLLTVIQGGLELVKLEGGLSPDLHASLDMMDVATHAAADLCRQMLAYSGRGLKKKELFLLRDLVEELRGLLQMSAGKGVSLNFDFKGEGKPIFADKGQVSQILLNLLTNASESITDSRHGDIRVAVRHRRLQEQHAHHFVGSALLPGDYTVLSVEDNGAGMDAAVLEHIFDPFFTTKFTGRGLGLSAIVGILNTHEAGLEVDSRPGDGTAMQVWFPCCDGSALSVSSPAQVLPDAFAGRVLLVDDEPGVIQVAHRMLEKLGLQVVAALGGLEAVDIFKHDSAFDWVLLDMTMPAMDGAECMQQLRRISPDIHVVMSSGYDADSVMHENCQPNDFLTKPYTMNNLRDVVRRAM